MGKLGHTMKNNIETIYPLLAKVGHKIPYESTNKQAEVLWEHFYDEDIQTYEMKRLSTLHDILNPNSCINDLVMLSETRKYSLDYDYKREVLSDGSTKPHNTINDFKRFRSVMNTLREKKKIRATPTLVAFYASRAKQGVRLRGSQLDDCTRHFCRGLVQGVYPFNPSPPMYKYLKNVLGEDFKVTVDKLKNAKRNPFVSNMVLNTLGNRRTIRAMLKKLGYESDNNYNDWLELLINKGLSNPVTIFN